jgi:hypothetical protein
MSGGTCVDGIGDAQEIHTVALEAAHEIDELLDASAEPIELPDNERVAVPKDVERLDKPRTGGNPSTGGVLQHRLAPSPFQRLVLHIKPLVACRDPGIPDEHVRTRDDRFPELVEDPTS